MNTKTSDWYRIPINNKANAFTIIELLVVIAIIGLLSSVVLVSMRGSTGKAKIAKSLEFSQTILNVIGVDAVGIWTFDEGEGDYAYDKSGYGNHGTRHGATWVTGEENTPHWFVNEGQGRWALKFDGNDYIGISNGSSLNPASMITMEAWVDMDEGAQCAGRYATIVGKGIDNHYQLRLGGDAGSCTFGTLVKTSDGLPQVFTSEKFSSNVWYHVVGSYNGSSLKIYVNGAEKASTPATGSMSPSTYPVEIGRRSNGYYFHGLIDEVRIYESALSSAEIQQHYAESAPRHQLAME